MKHIVPFASFIQFSVVVLLAQENAECGNKWKVRINFLCYNVLVACSGQLHVGIHLKENLFPAIKASAETEVI